LIAGKLVSFNRR